MIDSSKKRNSLVGVEVLSPYVIERRSKGFNQVLACFLASCCICYLDGEVEHTKKEYKFRTR